MRTNTPTHPNETPDQGHGERHPGAESPVRQQKHTLRAFAGALVGLFLLLAAVGCRTFVAQQVNLTVPDEAAAKLARISVVQLMYSSDLHAEQGQQIPVDALTELALSASQNGNADSTRDGDHSAPKTAN